MGRDREQDLIDALTVYDVTLACLEPYIEENMRKLLGGQIEAARDAYRETTGMLPMRLTRIHKEAVATKQPA
jgi:hypothetical protein